MISFSSPSIFSVIKISINIVIEVCHTSSANQYIMKEQKNKKKTMLHLFSHLHRVSVPYIVIIKKLIIITLYNIFRSCIKLHGCKAMLMKLDKINTSKHTIIKFTNLTIDQYNYITCHYMYSQTRENMKLKKRIVVYN